MASKKRHRTIVQTPLPLAPAKYAYTTNGGCPYLDGDYTIFGEVVDSMRVMESIYKVPVDEAEHPLKEETLLNTKAQIKLEAII